MKLFLVITFLLFFAFGCAYNKEAIVGVYSYDRHFEVNYKIEINQDSTFKFHWQHGLNFGTTEGTFFSLRKNSYVFNSLAPQEIINVKEKITRSDSISILLSDTSNRPLGYFIVEINDSIKVLTNEEGNIRLSKNIRINKIKIYFLNIPELIYKVQDSNSDFFIVKLNINFKKDIHFVNTNVKIKNKRLILKHLHLAKKKIILNKVR